MIESVLPDDVVTVTADALAGDDEAHLAGLFPEEAALVERAAPRRRAEFAAARACAHEALRRLGRPVVPIGRGERGAPLWPDGVVGALTHCEGLRAAAVAEAAAVRSVGVDVEPHAPLPRGVLGAVSLDDEARWVEAALGEGAGVRYDTLLFTAKEATYKAWFPLTHRWLGFEDARIRITTDPVRADGSPDARGLLASGDLHVRILVDPTADDGGPPLVELTGRWAATADHVASAVVLRPPPRPDAAVDTVAR